MCKLFAIVEIENQENALAFSRNAVKYVTETDNHGMGIMTLGEKGVHIQKWLEPPTVYRSHKSKALLKYADAIEGNRTESGIKSRHVRAIAIHGRFATCDKTIENTHPFFRDGTALMHNGIISNANQFERPLSTCDSEAILTQYIDHGVRNNQAALSGAMLDLAGYYAVIVFNDNGVIDIWRDDTATLFIAHVKDVGIVIATTAEIIIKTAKKSERRITGIEKMKADTHIRWTHGRNPVIMPFDSGDYEEVNVSSFVKDQVIWGNDVTGADNPKLWDTEAWQGRHYGHHTPLDKPTDDTPEDKTIKQDERNLICGM